MEVIPSHMVVNPEPNLRPTTTHPPHSRDGDHTSAKPVEVRNPVLMTDPAIDPTPGISAGTEPPRATTQDPQSQFRFGPNNGPHQPKTRNRRRNRNRRQFQYTRVPMALKDVATLAHFPSSSEAPSWRLQSTQMTLTVTQHQALLPLMITRIHDINYRGGAALQHHLHHSTRHLHAYIDTKSKGTTISNLSNLMQPNPADPPRDPTISPMDQRR